LFSAVVAALLAVSIYDLRPNSQDVSAFYLANIYRLQAEPNAHASSTSLLASPPVFSPPRYAIWVNSLWFLSLATSLTCGLLATSVQYWTHSYLVWTQTPLNTPQERARIREFLYRGMLELGFFNVSNMVLALIYLSLSLFFAGLLIFLFNINYTVFCAVVWLIAASAAGFLLVTLMPLYRLDSVYKSPFSRPVCRASAGLLYVIFHTLDSFIRVRDPASERFRTLSNHYRDFCIKGFTSTFLTAALKPSPKIDGRIINRTINIMNDRELIWVLERISGFSSSRDDTQAQNLLAHIHKGRLLSAMVAFLDRTSSSDLLSDWDRVWRLDLCMKVAGLAKLPCAGLYILDNFHFRCQHPVLQPGEMEVILRMKNCRGDQEIGLFAQCLIAGIISNVQGSDDRWIALAANQLGKSEGVIRGYLEHDNDSVLLANLIYTTRQILHSALGDGLSQGMADASLYILPSLSNFDIRNTLPVLRHDFLALWDEIAEKFREAPNDSVPTKIRDNLLNLYNALIQATDDVPTAPPGPDTNPHGDTPDSTSRIDEAIDESAHTDTTPSFRHDASLAMVPPHLPLPILAHSIADPTDELSLGGIPEPTQLIAQVAVSPPGLCAPEPLESHGLSGASQDVAAAATPTPGSIADTSSRGHSTIWPIPRSVPPADAHSPTGAAVIPSIYKPRDVRLESPPLVPISAASLSTLQLSSVLDPNITSTAPLGVHQGGQDLNDPIEIKSLHTRQSDPSAENLDPSDNPT
jgi:Family of unknown function (DUF6535)